MADAVVEKKLPKTVIFNFLKNNTMLIALVAVMVFSLSNGDANDNVFPV